MSERLLTAAEVAELLAVPESWVREQSRRGLLPRVQLGRYIRYQRETVLAWIAGQQAPSTARTRPERRI